MTTKRDRLTNALKATTAADMISYGFTADEAGCLVKLLTALGRSCNVVEFNAERFSNQVVEALTAGRKIDAIKHHRNDTGLGLAEAKYAVERLQDHLARRAVFT